MPDQKLFGDQITSACTYCRRNTVSNGELRCTISSADNGQHKPVGEKDSCSFFLYDPLLRKPATLPPQKFDPTDFTL